MPRYEKLNSLTSKFRRQLKDEKMWIFDLVYSFPWRTTSLMLWIDLTVYFFSIQGLTKIWEKLSEEEDKHIRALNHLKNDHLFSEYEIEYFDWLPWMVSYCVIYPIFITCQLFIRTSKDLLYVINVKMLQHNAELGMPQRKLKGVRTWPSMQRGGHRHVPVAGGVCSSLPPCKPYCTWRSSSWACERSSNKQGT